MATSIDNSRTLTKRRVVHYSAPSTHIAQGFRVVAACSPAAARLDSRQMIVHVRRTLRLRTGGAGREPGKHVHTPNRPSAIEVHAAEPAMDRREGELVVVPLATARMTSEYMTPRCRNTQLDVHCSHQANWRARGRVLRRQALRHNCKFVDSGVLAELRNQMTAIGSGKPPRFAASSSVHVATASTHSVPGRACLANRDPELATRFGGESGCERGLLEAANARSECRETGRGSAFRHDVRRNPPVRISGATHTPRPQFALALRQQS